MLTNAMRMFVDEYQTLAPYAKELETNLRMMTYAVRMQVARLASSTATAPTFSFTVL